MRPHVLIVNRGEIAVRALEAAEQLRWSATLFCTPADRQTLAFRKANQTWMCEDSHPQESYMNLEIIRKAIRETKAQFLYPGFGFLSENPALAELCANEKITFVGPSAEILHLMSNKEKASEFALSCGLKTLRISQKEQIKKFPVLLKAARGGGGRGNVIVQSQTDLESSINALRTRAVELFHDGNLLFEHYLPQARHVEIQVFGTNEGVEFLGTRDCSVQRRFQKSDRRRRSLKDNPARD